MSDTCDDCGCTDEAACPGECHWVKPGLCSACHQKIIDELRPMAAAWALAQGEPGQSAGAIAGKPCTLDLTPTDLTVRDHLGVTVFQIDADGDGFLAAHYAAAELLPLFEIRT